MPWPACQCAEIGVGQADADRTLQSERNRSKTTSRTTRFDIATSRALSVGAYSNNFVIPGEGNDEMADWGGDSDQDRRARSDWGQPVYSAAGDPRGSIANWLATARFC